MYELFSQGEDMTREQFRQRLNAIPDYVLSAIKAGPGIRLLPTGVGGMCIMADGGGANNQGMGIGGDGGFLTAGVIALHPNGNDIGCALWDPATEAWSEDTFTVKKPWIFQKDSFNGIAFTYTDGRAIAYDVTDLEAKYQRRATWLEGEDLVSEVQEITPAYAVYEAITVCAYDGAYRDINTAGRSWARALGY